MNWNEVKSKLGAKCQIKEIAEDTIEFEIMNRLFRLHRFEIPDGFLVKPEIIERYNGRLVLYEKINNEWKFYR